MKLVHGLPLLQRTRLGWVVTGGGDRLRGNTSLFASQRKGKWCSSHSEALKDVSDDDKEK